MKTLLLPLILCLVWHVQIFAQAGAIDTTFGSVNAFTGSGSVSALVQQPDGKLLVGGDFKTYQGFFSQNIVRLHPDGAVDTSFKAGTGTGDRGVNTIAVQEDGKIIIAGYFKAYNGISRPNIARLDTNGALDLSFDPGTGLEGNRSIFKVAALENGKILVGGGFPTFNGLAYSSIVRLNSNGSVDTTFNPGTGVMGFGVYDFAIQDDGKIVIVGNINQFNGVSTNNILRLNENGSIDSTFMPGGGAAGTVRRVDCVTIQSDGKILIGGAFSTYDSVVVNGIARLNTNGTLDQTFQMGTGFTFDPNDGIFQIAVQQNQKLLVGGRFTSYNGMTVPNILRVSSTGAFDNSFNPLSGPNYSIYVILLQSDGKILLAGGFTKFNGVAREGIVRLLNDDVSSIQLLPAESFVVFPNPSNGECFVKTNLSQPIKFSLFDISGKLMQEGYTTGQLTRLHFSFTAPGVYFLRVGESTKKIMLTGE